MLCLIGDWKIEGYSLGIDVLDQKVGKIPPGSNIMIVGPPMTGKSVLGRMFFYNRLKDGSAGIFVSTKDTGEKVIDWFKTNDLDISRAKYGIIDCVSRTLQMDINLQDTDRIRYVSSPVDLTGISVKVNDLLEEFWKKEQIRSIGVVIESLSALLMYSNLQTVFRFLHVFSGRIRSVDAAGMYLIEEGMHDPRTQVTLKQLFQGVIETKDEGGEKLLQVIAPGCKVSGWFRYNFEGAKIDLKEI